MKKLIALVALLLLAASPSPFVWGPWGEPDVTQQPVEQQTEGGATQPDQSLWVVNNTGCAWDADDSRFSGATDGTLAPGVTATGSRCVISDWNEHAVYVNVNSKSPDLVLTLSYEPQGYVFPAARRLVDGRYVYEICVKGVDYTENVSPELQPIPNSGYGGVGVVTTFTYSLRNPTSRTVRDTHGRMTLRAVPDLACGSGWTFTRTGTYPGPFVSPGTRVG
jgi:hypothetical protein